MKRIGMIWWSVSMLLTGLVFAPALTAQEPRREAENTITGTVDIQQDTQRQRDAWAVDKTELQNRYRSLQSELDYLGRRTTAEGERVAAKQARADELQRRLDESIRLEASLQDTLDAILGRIETWVEGDLPFLPDERGLCLEALRGELARPEATPGEKLRRVLEALQVETGYGLTVEVYQDRIDVQSESLFVDVLRVGRLVLYWRTPDGDRVGWHDPGLQAWVELPSRHHRRIGLAMEMATRMRPVEPVSLPLGRVAP